MGQGMNKFTGNRILRGLGYCLAFFLSLLFLLFVVELVLASRFFREGGRAPYSIAYNRRLHPPLWDATMEPGREYLARCEGLKVEPYRLATNKDGLIIGPRQYDRKTSLDSCDVVFFGGSTTECVFVRDSLRFPYRVGSLLSDRMKREVVVLNASMSSNHTFHSVSNLVHTCLPYRPKMAVLMHNINDLALLSKSGSYFDAPPGRGLTLKRGEPGSLFSFIVLRYFPNLHRIFNRSANELRKASVRLNGEEDDFQAWRSRTADTATVLREYRKALRTFHGVCEANGIGLVLMTQFNRLDAANRDFVVRYFGERDAADFMGWMPVYDGINRLIREYAQRNGLVCIDLDRLIPKNSGFIYDPVHLNNEGSRLAGDIIADRFFMSDTLRRLLAK